MYNKLLHAERDINNVNGDQYIINNPTFNILNENAQDQFVLQKMDNVNYFDELKERLSEKILITRTNVLQDIEKLLTNEESLLVYGEPGIGKTTLVGDISISNRIIYISLRDRSIEEVLEYLVGCYGLQFNRDEDIFFMFEGLLSSSDYLFVFDDCESNKEVVRKLERLSKSRNKFLYLSRNKGVFTGIKICKYELRALTKEEVKEFIKLSLKNELEDSFIEELFIKSKGNPLYLYYYINFSINPLPSGLENYQDALWDNLSSEQREMLACIAITNFPIKREVLEESLYKLTRVKNTIMEFQKKITCLEYLLNIRKGSYDIFHPLFKEYILRYISESGIKSEYEVIVGESAIEKKCIVEGTLLLLDKDNEEINEYLLQVGVKLYNSSRITQSIKVLENALIKYENQEDYRLDYASTNYYISIIYMDINDKEKGFNCINKAIEIYKQLNDKKGYFVCIVIKAVFFAEEGKKKNVEELLMELEGADFSDNELKAYVHINMSKINIMFNQYEKAAINAKMAYEYFITVGNKDGAVKSLLNYSGALSNIDQEDLATAYLEMILNDDIMTLNKPIKAAIMNNLTSCYRKNKEYDKAITACNESINIMKELKQYSKLAMNMLNLGNIYRDLKDWAKCEEIYIEGIKIAKEYKITREIGRGYELMASISYMQNKYNDCIEYAEKAIKASTQVNDDFRVAESYVEMSRGYLALDCSVAYSNCIEQAIRYYLKEDFIDEAVYHLIKLIKYYDSSYNEVKFKEYLKELSIILSSQKEINYELLCCNLVSVFEDNESTNIVVDLYYNIIINIIKSENTLNLIELFNEFVDLCKNNINNRIKEIFINIINIMIEESKNNSLLINIVAFMIVSSGKLVEREDVDAIIQNLKENYEDIYIRKCAVSERILTLYWECGVYIQYCCDTSQLINDKVTLALYLISKFNEAYIISKVNNIECKYIDFNVLDFKSMKESIGETEFLSENKFKEVPVVFSSAVRCDIPTYIILTEEYETKRLKEVNIKNDIFIYTIMNTFIQLTKRISNQSLDDVDQQASIEARKFVESLISIKLEDDCAQWTIQPLSKIIK